MGEVYRARDTRLGRDVAIKVLPAAASADPERLARFEREARTLATLNHPNIAQIYGVEETQGIAALVMELITGATLAERLASASSASARGLDLTEALPIARQIAEALEAAHEAGIVHRDLKPANVKVRDDGVVKVLDFGLAKMLDPAHPSAADSQDAATVTSPAMTVHGTILGTAAYMAPEQARGQIIDRRADIWSFGVVLFEMLSGRRPFEGADVMETLSAVIGKTPDFTRLDASVPSRVRELVQRCLVRDRRQRLQAIGEARITLEEAIARGDTGGDHERSAALPPRWRRVFPWLVAAAMGLVAAWLWAWRPAPSSLSVPMRFDAELSPSIQIAPTLGPTVQFSPDGTLIAFRGRSTGRDAPRLFVRRLDEPAAQPLNGTEDVFDFFFSPDSKWLGFFAGTKLKRISIAGGSASTICDIGNARGGAWTPDGFIIFAPNSRAALARVPAGGGTPQPITALDEAIGEITHRFPQLLPGGKAILYTAHTNSVAFDDANVYVQPLAGGERRVVVRGGYQAQYVNSGHVLYVHDGRLMAQPFDLDALEARATPALALEDLATQTESAGAQFAVSPSGTLAYLPVGDLRQDVRLAWLERQGKSVLLRPSGQFRWPQFSPDGRRIALAADDRAGSDIWIYEWQRDIMTPLTRDPANDERPLWSPDGTRIVYSSDRAGNADIYWKRADGFGTEQQLTRLDTQEREVPLAWHPRDFKLAITVPMGPASNLSWLAIDGDETSGWRPGAVEPFSTRFGRLSLSFSPDGRWVAYASDEAGSMQVYVRRFPELDRTLQISTDGGNFPVWSARGGEVFYQQGADRIVIVSVSTTGGDLRPGKPTVFGEARLASPVAKSFDVHPDGERVLILAAPEAAATATRAVFIVNFVDQLRRIAPPDAVRQR
jgi:serine/threonine-protein kinase